jgi:hypothetical protein
VLIRVQIFSLYCGYSTLTGWVERRRPFELTVSGVALVCCACSGGVVQLPSDDCGRPGACEGAFQARVDVNSCPWLSFLYVAPAVISVGGSAHFGARVEDPDGDRVYLDWTATGAGLSGRAEIFDTLTCLLPGTQTLTLWYSDSRGCADYVATELECVPRVDDAGG